MRVASCVATQSFHVAYFFLPIVPRVLLLLILALRRTAAIDCWQGAFTHELCCGDEHGPEGNVGCWDEVYTFSTCCKPKGARQKKKRISVVDASQAVAIPSGDALQQPQDEDASFSCWHGEFSSEKCCGWEYGLEGNVECWDETYTFSRCCESGTVHKIGCESEQLQRFRTAVVEYYETGRARPDVVKIFPRLVANLGSYMTSCAPAALQALLLHQEDRMVLDPLELRLEKMAEYNLRMQQALENGYLAVSDLKKWPLATGLSQAKQIVSALERRPNVTLVISYCREPLDWMRTTLSRSLIPSLSLAFVRKCQGVDVFRNVPLRRLWRSIDVVDVVDLPLKADECSAYMGYLAQRHDVLPEYMFFIHGDAPEHIGSLERPNMLDDTIRAVVNGLHIPFAHLSNNRVTMRWEPFSMATLWRGLFGPGSVLPGPKDVATYCCAHFVLARSRALLRNQAWYANAMRFLMSPESYFYLPGVPRRPRAAARNDLASRLPCQNMMFLWHIVFGEDLFLPHRMFDPKLPLFAKLRNVRLKYLEGNGPA